MNRFKLLIWALAILLISSCTFVPKVVYDNDDRRCNLTTHQRELKLMVPRGSYTCGVSNNEEARACLALAVVYTAATGIVSGSIVLVGNTVHWLEKQGKCDDSFLNQQIFNHNKPLLDQDGELVSTDNKPDRLEVDPLVGAGQ